MTKLHTARRLRKRANNLARMTEKAAKALQCCPSAATRAAFKKAQSTWIAAHHAANSMMTAYYR